MAHLSLDVFGVAMTIVTIVRQSFSAGRVVLGLQIDWRSLDLFIVDFGKRQRRFCGNRAGGQKTSQHVLQ